MSVTDNGFDIPPMPGYQRHGSAETEYSRLRRECIEWLSHQTGLTPTDSRIIMEHCFAVSLKLLNRNPDA